MGYTTEKGYKLTKESKSIMSIVETLSKMKKCPATEKKNNPRRARTDSDLNP